MSIEGKPEQFDKEKFKSDFKIALTRYGAAVLMLHNNPYANDLFEKDKKSFESDETNSMEQMIKLSVKMLKLSGNKQEILSIIHETIREANIRTSPQNEYDEILSEQAFLKDIILELLKGDTLL